MSQMTVWKTFKFDAAHSLPHLPASHKCSKLHGHTYSVTVYVTGEMDKGKAWVIDYADIKKAFDPIFQRLDHNNVDCWINPSTAENLAMFIWHELKPSLPGLSKLIVQETADSGVEYIGDLHA